MRHQRVDRGCTRYRQATAAVSRCRRNARGEASRSGRGTHGSGGRRFDEDEHERKALIHRGDCKVGVWHKPECCRLDYISNRTKVWSDTQAKYTCTELELLSILLALKKWRPLLLGTTVVVRIYTDHSANASLHAKKSISHMRLNYLPSYL
eukprot:COSAG01_NODE_10710_length_2096_cov_100.564847_2_plen_151_part_00